MSKIQVLDKETINQIAAGEVIDRPASVVKELMENAIDAGATIITVEIKDGGVSLIRISDNGCGIDKDDIRTAFLRHSTSKIKNALDLYTVTSLGFRGEALSSIAAVCQVTLITKTKDSLTGSRYVIEGGNEVTLEDVGTADGTTFLIKNIFFNTPARRKFLKSFQTEAGYIADILEHIAISHPEISVRFISNGQARIHTSGNGKLKDVIYNIYGKDTCDNLIYIDSKCNYISVKGYIGKPILNKGNRGCESYFINGRYIKSSLISRAIEDAYKPYLMQHKFPFTALLFQVEPEFIDVNVHPSKMELRFRNADVIVPFIIDAIASGLRAGSIIPDVKFDQVKDEKPVISRHEEKLAEPFEESRINQNQILLSEDTPKVDLTTIQQNTLMQDPLVGNVLPESSVAQNSIIQNTLAQNSVSILDVAGYQAAVELQQELENNLENKISAQSQPLKANVNTINNQNNQNNDSAVYSNTMTLFDDNFLSKKARVRHKIVGQIFSTYWIVEYDNKMFIIDQHAAHEKVLYEKLMHRLKTRTIESQMLNPPLIITLSLKEENLVNAHLEDFSDIGFEIEHFGGNEYAVRSIPMDLYALNYKDILTDIIDSLEDDSDKINSELLSDRIATMSCKAAIKGNNVISTEEANELIDQLLSLENPYNCPHGRPTIISMTKYELEKKFKRIV